MTSGSAASAPTASPPSADAAAERVGSWLALALLLLPGVYRIPWDTNRVAPLILLAPALLFGRPLLDRACNRLLAGGWRTWLPMLALISAVTIGTARSPHWAGSLVVAASWLLLALGALLTREILTQRPPLAWKLLGAMAASSAGATLLHWLFWRMGASPVSAFYVHHRLMGLHALAGALAAVALLRDPDPRAARLRGIAWVIGIITWASFLWAGSRSTVLGLAAALAVWFWRSDRAGRRRLPIVAGGLLLGGLALSLVNWSDKSYLGWWHWWSRAAEAGVAVDASALSSHRSDFWRGAIAHLGDAPWFGLGPDAYGYLTPRLEGAQPHNLLLQLLLDVGIVGTLAAGGSVARVLRAGARSPAALDWLAAALGFVVAAQVDGYFFYPLAAFPALLALGACAAPAIENVSDAPSRAARAWRPVALAAASVLLLHIWLFRVIVHGAPPATPHAFAARVWRHFPSVTYNIDAWADAWAERYPDAALATSRLAVPHSQSPDFFRVQIARLLLARGDRAGAIRELELAAAEAMPDERPAIESILARTRRPPAAPR